MKKVILIIFLLNFISCTKQSTDHKQTTIEISSITNYSINFIDYTDYSNSDNSHLINFYDIFFNGFNPTFVHNSL